MNMSDLRTMVRRAWLALVATLHNGFAAVGVAAIMFVVLDGAALLQAATDTAPAVAEAEEVSAVTPAVDPDPRYRALATQLAKKYRVAVNAPEPLVHEAFAAGQAVGVDPLLILAVISVESRFNPIAESEFGARGLMQVVPRFHLDKLAHHGGEDAVLDPRTNIRVGAKILKEYIQRAGSVESGLQMYAGAADDPNTAYAQRVMTEKSWLQRSLPPVRRSGSTSA
jgi:soluble lytic murein transglycosylase-like protein